MRKSLLSLLFVSPFLTSCEALHRQTSLERRWERAAEAYVAEQETTRPVAASAPRRVIPQSFRAPSPEGRLASKRTFIHDVQDLLSGAPSFVAPEVGLVASSSADEELGVTRTPAIDPDLLVELIQGSVDPESWDDEGNSVDVWNGRLIVRRGD